MSIHLAVQLKEQAAKIAELERLLKANTMQAEIDSLKSRLDALESRPKPGRPPKDKNG
jgi:hypothetical protein